MASPCGCKKEADFIGRDALLAAKEAGLERRRLACLVLDDPRSVALGNEPVRVDGERRRPRHVRRLRLRGRAQHRVWVPAPSSSLRSGRRAEVEVFGEWVGCTVSAEPLYDPAGERVKG